ncbi:hypothetical protein H5410_023217 [Solanum commersonii]|uniref:Uncharacterized protein n=1 Tax=Solanum commersonii TaxID=4109 RepID=A0A9J5ZIZ2_SOLCO|nr:hypothetical protein H5410_023217 [Solanum commersonii]
MGNGNFQDDNPHTTCHMRQVLYGVGYNQLVQPDESLVQTHQSRCYHEGSQHNAHDYYWDYNFLFGGGGIEKFLTENTFFYNVNAAMRKTLYFGIARDNLTVIAMDGSPITKPFTTDYVELSIQQSIDCIFEAN